jgi:small subunit ribosomal protein S1
MTTTLEQNGNNLEPKEAVATFAEMLDDYDYSLPQQGQILQGKILRVEDDAIFMDVGAKRDAIVPHTDLERLDEELIQSLEKGAEIPVYVLKTPVGDEELLVSINKGLEQKDWNRAEELIEKDETLELEVDGYNKGGLLVRFGQLQGFVPNSHVPDLRYGGSPAEIESRKAKKVGEILLVKVLEANQQRRRLIFSAKAAHKEQRKRRLRNLEVGTVIEGRVANIVNYGAFVDIGGGVSGLLHVSELAWHRVEHPSKVLEVGEELEVEIQDVDVERERVSLSRKAVMPNPWDTIEERYNIGDLVEGTVTNVEDFGAFVEVQSGVVGLVHVSEIDIYGPATIHDIIRRGDEVLVRIIDIDPYEERLSLSLRRVTSEEQIEWMRRHEDEEEEAPEQPEAEESEAAAVEGEAEAVSDEAEAAEDEETLPDEGEADVQETEPEAEPVAEVDAAEPVAEEAKAESEESEPEAEAEPVAEEAQAVDDETEPVAEVDEEDETEGDESEPEVAEALAEEDVAEVDEAEPVAEEETEPVA